MDESIPTILYVIAVAPFFVVPTSVRRRVVLPVQMSLEYAENASDGLLVFVAVN